MRRIDVLEILVRLLKRKRLIFRATGITFLLCLILFFVIIPRWYKSTTTILPPKQKNTLGLLGALSRSSTPLKTLGLGSGSDDLSQFQAIVLSRSAMDEVSAKFDLQSVYGERNLEETVKELRSNVSVGLGKEDISLEISVYDQDRQRAADIANYFVETLNKIYIDISLAEAKANREFLEIRYNQNLRDLAQAENQMTEFQKKYGVYSVPEQAKAAIEAAATLKAHVTLKEVESDVLKKSVGTENMQYQYIQGELHELKKQLGKMKYGGESTKDEFQIFAPFEKAPEVGMEYFRKYRNVEIQGKILELIVPLYEQARIEEQRNTPSVLVLDRAIPAERPTKPKRLILTFVMMIIAFVGASWYVLLDHRWRQLALVGSSDFSSNLNSLKEELKPSKLFREL